jgi:Na+-translocating ferredoxin:NAD+ oxidoreductase RnfD subunit
VIDYFTPGIFAWGYEFGYIILILVLLAVLGVIIIGLKIMKVYKEKRERGNKTLLGREALLIGSLTAFMGQAWVGFFIINRDINGTALVTFLFLGAMVLGHVLMVKKS